ncbi:unnamed protein product [Boreogadus saida]
MWQAQSCGAQRLSDKGSVGPVRLGCCSAIQRHVAVLRRAGAERQSRRAVLQRCRAAQWPVNEGGGDLRASLNPAPQHHGLSLTLKQETEECGNCFSSSTFDFCFPPSIFYPTP